MKTVKPAAISDKMADIIRRLDTLIKIAEEHRLLDLAESLEAVAFTLSYIRFELR